MPTFPEGATDEERAELDDLWAAERACVDRLQAFMGTGKIGKAKQVLAEAERTVRSLDREADDLKRAHRDLPANHRKAYTAATAAVDAARYELDVVLGEKQAIVDAREEPKAQRHALRARIHTRGGGRRRQEAAV